ncbi:MAG: DegT/DnrJ/EryC1/StrS family aminotransferase [Planctomycetes bacterium]|nr:DegT/DnrJ/EryC1/StrS family aminotransferase [Planctomycetota bacterium]
MTSSPWRIPLSRPQVDEEAVQEVASVLRSPILSIGPRLQAFEHAFARFIGSRYAIGVSSGTCGLHLAVKLLGLGPGAEAITTPFSFIASANCLLFENARPVFVDIDPDSFLLDLELVEEALTPRTRALLPVHVFGNVLDMARVMAIARLHGLAVIEDACEAVGAAWQGRRTGSWGDLGVFGFYPNKQMTTGEGGMVVTSREDFHLRLRGLRNQGRSLAGDGSFSELGYNYRMPEMAAALGAAQLKSLPAFLQERRRRERFYQQILSGLDELRVPPIPPERSPFVFIVQTREPALRDHLQAQLTERGIQSAVYFRPIHLEKFYRERFGYREGAFPRAEHAGQTCLAIPFYNQITEEEQRQVADAIRQGLAQWLNRSRAAVLSR